MGRDLRGKELGVGLGQQKDGLYTARFMNRFGNRKIKRFKKLQDARQWIADSTYKDAHCDLSIPEDLIVDAWFEYWIDYKKKTVRANTVRNYTERYEHNIKAVLGKMRLSDVKPLHCQKIFFQMADAGYATSTLYQTRITLYNMFEFAKENELIPRNPCKRSVRSDIGKESKKKRGLTRPIQKKLLEGIVGNSYEDQFRFILQTGLRTGELIGLKWEDVDFQKNTISIQRSMEYRYSVGEWKEGPPKSEKGYRTIPLTDEAVRILKRQKEKHKTIKVIPREWVDQVFLCRKGTPIKNSTYDAALMKICDKIGIPRISMHILRHTFATRCYEGGMNMKTLSVLLGHSNIGITMNLYVHATDEEKAKEIILVSNDLLAI